jgi:nucleoside-diphosphate-sugar epimerase
VQESLAFAYDDHGDRWIDEAEPLASSPYTDSVIEAERQAARFTATAGAGATAVVLRFGQFYSPDSNHSASMVRAARRGWSMMPGAPAAYTVTIAADDAAQAVATALTAPAGTFNIVDDEPLTRAEWADALAAAVGRRRLRAFPRVASGVAARQSSTLVSSQRVANAAFEAATAWRPVHRSFRDGARWLVDADAPAASGADR